MGNFLHAAPRARLGKISSGQPNPGPFQPNMGMSPGVPQFDSEFQTQLFLLFLSPSPDQSDRRGEKQNLQSGKSHQDIFGTQTSQTPPPHHPLLILPCPHPSTSPYVPIIRSSPAVQLRPRLFHAQGNRWLENNAQQAAPQEHAPVQGGRPVRIPDPNPPPPPPPPLQTPPKFWNRSFSNLRFFFGGKGRRRRCRKFFVALPEGFFFFFTRCVYTQNAQNLVENSKNV